MSGETRCRIEKRKRAGSRLRSFLLPSMTARASAQLAYCLTVGVMETRQPKRSLSSPFDKRPLAPEQARRRSPPYL